LEQLPDEFRVLGDEPPKNVLARAAHEGAFIVFTGQQRRVLQVWYGSVHNLCVGVAGGFEACLLLQLIFLFL
jgi:hypothetical protein